MALSTPAEGYFLRLLIPIPDTLRQPPISSAWLLELMQNSRARRQIVLLDGCFGGAFARGYLWRGEQVEAGESLRIPDPQLEGRGQVVIASADAMQFALEDGVVNGQPPVSHFMLALAEGLRTGAADLDGDGGITIDELMRFVRSELKRSGSPQTPREWKYGRAVGDLLFAFNPHSLFQRWSK
jgi:hypothetical protein